MKTKPTSWTSLGRSLRQWLLLFFLSFSLVYIHSESESPALGQTCAVMQISKNACDALILRYRISPLLQMAAAENFFDGPQVFYPDEWIAPLSVQSASGLPFLLTKPSASSDAAQGYSSTGSLISGLDVSVVAMDPSKAASEMNWASEVGTIGEIDVKIHLIKSIIDLVLSGEKMTEALNLNLSVNGLEIMPYLRFEGHSTLALDNQLKPFLSNLTIRLSTEFLNSVIDTNTKLDPQTLDFLKENLKITIGLGGSTLFSGETTFERGQGLTSQVFGIESAVGDIRIAGQAIFTPTSQEFRIGASVCNLAFSGSSLITASGQIQQTFGFEIKFGGVDIPTSSCK